MNVQKRQASSIISGVSQFNFGSFLYSQFVLFPKLVAESAPIPALKPEENKKIFMAIGVASDYVITTFIGRFH